ncbi:MAG: hypothetical protein IPM48_05235 [Saprospiraceae bacterium]|nr:hypothetical protein [Saprospiraceae bacterium]
MIQQKTFSMHSGRNIFQRILGSLALVTIVALVFYLFYQIYKLLYLISPVFLLIAVILYPRVILHHLKVIQRTFQTSLMGGLLTVGLQVIALPFVAIGLIFKAWAYRKFGNLQEEGLNDQNTNFSSYEEVLERSTEIPNKTEQRRKESEKLLSTYDDLFE